MIVSAAFDETAYILSVFLIVSRSHSVARSLSVPLSILHCRGDAAWGADTELPPADLFLGSLPVIIPEISNMRKPSERPPDPPTMMEQVGRMARPKTNCAMAVITGIKVSAG